MSDLRMNQPAVTPPAADNRRGEQFRTLMRILQAIALLITLGLVLAGLLWKQSTLFLLAVDGLLLYAASVVARKVAHSGRLGLALWGLNITMFVAMAWLPLVFGGMLPPVVGGGMVMIMILALYASPRTAWRLTPLAALAIALPLWLDLWRPYRVVEFPLVGMALALVILLFAGVLMRQLADRMQQTAEASRNTMGELNRARRELMARADEVQEMAEELARERARLESTSMQLTESLDTSRRRAALLDASARVNRAVAQVRDMDTLLTQVTFLISQQFGFYHVGIFMLDESRLYAVMRATNSEGGQRMLARGHRLAVGTTGIVGFVTGTGRPRIALDVGADATFFDNPDLPETRSEMAVPMMVGGRVIGALDIQSKDANAFGDEDVTVLATLADQIAVAIENADLLQQTQAALIEARTAQRRSVRQEWDRFLGAPAATGRRQS